MKKLIVLLLIIGVGVLIARTVLSEHSHGH